MRQQKSVAGRTPLEPGFQTSQILAQNPLWYVNSCLLVAFVAVPSLREISADEAPLSISTPYAEGYRPAHTPFFFSFRVGMSRMSHAACMSYVGYKADTMDLPRTVCTTRTALAQEYWTASCSELASSIPSYSCCFRLRGLLYSTPLWYRFPTEALRLAIIDPSFLKPSRNQPSSFQIIRHSRCQIRRSPCEVYGCEVCNGFQA